MPADAPEDRAAAARRVARDLASDILAVGAVDDDTTPEALAAIREHRDTIADCLADAMLAFPPAGPAEPVAACENHPIVNHSLLCGAPQCCDVCCRAAAAEAGLPTFEAPGGDAEPMAWEESARQFARDADYYRGLVVEIGKALGEAAYIADDGTRSEDVLCAKVPELVRAALAAPVAGEAGALRKALEQLAALRPDYTNPEDYVRQIREIISAALAPGGRPRCERCDDLGYVTWSEPDQVGNEERHRAPCPKCCPAEATWALVDGVPRCNACGYSERDCALHLDHGLCPNPDPPEAPAPRTEER